MLRAMARILVVDDEPNIVEIVRAYLAREGHDVVTATDGETALDLARSTQPDLVVLDVMLPRRSGFDVLRELRAAGSPVAVLMLTARDDVIDRVAGLEMGADDYVTKPFEPREIVARVGTILRRTPSQAAVPRSGRVLFDLTVDEAGREVVRGGEVVALTRVEFDLLSALAARPGTVLTREQLGELLFGESFDAYDRTIDSHVKNLRHKLGPRPGGEQYIETVRGVGYRAARP
jgi:DNA-binding response OmpR family regulator